MTCDLTHVLKAFMLETLQKLVGFVILKLKTNQHLDWIPSAL